MNAEGEISFLQMYRVLSGVKEYLYQMGNKFFLVCYEVICVYFRRNTATGNIFLPLYFLEK